MRRADGLPEAASPLIADEASQRNDTVCHVWTYMDPARLQQVGWIRIAGHNC
ncbi:MAG: hypothetical protein JWR49_3280 [Tardiphaga sp.]|nr:hypothetical protein [Tardiphaga sp.]